MSVLMMIESLEKKLTDCLIRLDQSERRARILEKWIFEGFGFNIQDEINKENPFQKPVAKIRSSQNKRFVEMEKTEIYETRDSQADDPPYSPSAAQDQTNKNSSSSQKRGGGRLKESCWKHFRQGQVSHSGGSNRPSVYCKRCNARVSGRASRLKEHLAKCPGWAGSKVGSKKTTTKPDVGDDNCNSNSSSSNGSEPQNAPQKVWLKSSSEFLPTSSAQDENPSGEIISPDPDPVSDYFQHNISHSEPQITQTQSLSHFPDIGHS